MEEDSWKHNIEGIMKVIKERLKLTIQLKKFSGISFEGRTPIDGNRDSAILEIESVLDELELTPYSIIRNEDVSNAYLVQFPELDVIYSNEEKLKIYRNLFRFFLDNINHNRKEQVPKSVILDGMDVYIKQTILAFVRGHINTNKLSEKDLLNDLEYRKHLESLFIHFVDDYYKEKVLNS